ncbi:hypothetical protein BKA58DRAFT_189547 [Alternaria rosae]|uniref:uncharacterized protein n=1 Tax=Alternaria rosae TaxID=1187941 RepID=UPI001E8EC796|nr:uncharacterized protein BKA58DRAFT_189547 [Alternaria rosae]KAH6868175.1 hypothetical protein BKA58DRAFT_189547 [Alternaria rosae]
MPAFYCPYTILITFPFIVTYHYDYRHVPLNGHENQRIAFIHYPQKELGVLIRSLLLLLLLLLLIFTNWGISA